MIRDVPISSVDYTDLLHPQTVATVKYIDGVVEAYTETTDHVAIQRVIERQMKQPLTE